MTLNTSQVSYYMTQRKKGATQHISAMKAGISVRSGRRIEKDQWSKAGERHWRTRKDPLEAVWDSELVPLGVRLENGNYPTLRLLFVQFGIDCA